MSDESFAGYERVKQKVGQQLKDLGLQYIDLYMLHSPLSNKELQAQTWRALTELYHAGVIKSLGVSNFSGAELRHIVDTSEVPPMVVQNKFDVYHQGKQLDSEGDDVVAYAKSRGIALVAYSSFSAYPFAMLPTYDPIVIYLAQRQSVPVTPAMLLLRWTLQLGGTAVIPRSTSKARLQENLSVLTMAPISEEHMAMLNLLQYLISSPVYRPS